MTVEEALPATFYADAPTPWRVQMLAEAWARAMKANAELEAIIARELGNDFLSLQALYINQLNEVRGLKEAILKHGLHHYTCAHVGASRETAMFERRPIPPCNCWMAIAGQPEPDKFYRPQV